MKDWFLWVVSTLFLWGFWGFLPKLATHYISPMSALVFEVIGGTVVGICALFFVGFRPETHPLGILFAVSTGIVGVLGSFFYLMAVSKGKVSVIVVVTSLYPVITVVLAHFILDEPISIREGLGIILAFSALVLCTVQ